MFRSDLKRIEQKRDMEGCSITQIEFSMFNGGGGSSVKQSRGIMVRIFPPTGGLRRKLAVGGHKSGGVEWQQHKR